MGGTFETSENVYPNKIIYLSHIFEILKYSKGNCVFLYKWLRKHLKRINLAYFVEAKINFR